MATPIVIELQRLASDSQCPLVDLLRKALIVATKLNLTEFREWITSELNGYDGSKELPDYRRLHGQLTAVTAQGERPLGFGRGNEELEQLVSSAPMFKGVAELEALSRQPTLYVIMPTAQMQLLHQYFGNNRFIPQLQISPASVRGILDIVRNEILDWALKLEQQGIVGDGMMFSEDERNKAATSGPTFHIGSIGSVTGNMGNVSAHNLQIGGFSSINDQLKTAGISQAERNELENIMDGVKTATPQEKPGLVQKGMDWIGRNAENLGAIAGALRSFFQNA